MFRCPYCRARFYTYRQFLVHMRKHGKNKTPRRDSPAGANLGGWRDLLITRKCRTESELQVLFTTRLPVAAKHHFPRSYRFALRRPSQLAKDDFRTVAENPLRPLWNRISGTSCQVSDTRRGA